MLFIIGCKDDCYITSKEVFRPVDIKDLLGGSLNCSGGDIIIDRAYRLLNSRKTQSKVNKLATYCIAGGSKVRRIILQSPKSSMLDKRMRELADCTIDIRDTRTVDIDKILEGVI